jgi:hypothetical protein
MSIRQVESPQRADISRFFESPEDTLAERTSLIAKRDDKNLALLAAMKRTRKKAGDSDQSITAVKMEQFLEHPAPSSNGHDHEGEGSTVSSEDEEELSKSYTAAAAEIKLSTSSSSGACTPKQEKIDSFTAESKRALEVSRDDSSSHMAKKKKRNLCVFFFFY